MLLSIVKTLRQQPIMSENKNTCHKWAEQNMSTMRNRVGECSKNQTLKKMQVNIPCRCMHEREMDMQSGERGNLAVLFLLVCAHVCVCLCV